MRSNRIPITVALIHWLTLSLTDGIGPILARRVVAAAGGPAAACEASADLLANIEGIGLAKSRKIAASLRRAAALADEELERGRARGVSLLSPDDEPYPLLLRSIPDPPLVLYVRGSLEARDLMSVAIVGSRRCSFYGREQAERFGALLGGAGITVVSGGARGVDSAAHRGALSHPQGRTLAVLGSGVDVPYPPENAPLFNQIAERGAVISEYPLGASPARENFPRRNRIVSGLSRGVLIVEADERSGALITARQAGEDHGRVVFALPGRVDNPLSTGPHQLIRDGATLVTKLEDILEALGPLPAEAQEPTLFSGAVSTRPESQQEAKSNPPIALLTDRQKKLISAMREGESINVDTLVERSGLPAHEILQDLTFLTLKGQVKRQDGQTYLLLRQ